VVNRKDKVKVKVVGPNVVGGVEAPGTVELDPDETNIPALVESGQVELIDPLPEDDTDAPKTTRKARDKS